MKLYITIFLITLSTFKCLSQENLSNAIFDYNGEEFSAKMNAHIKKNANTLSGYLGAYFVKNDVFRHTMDTACEAGVALIKFKLNLNGISEIACTKSTHPNIAKMFKEAILKSFKYWKVVNDSDLYYILPIHYNFKYNCNNIQFKKENIESDYIFNFDDGINLEETQCIVLKSYKFMSGLKENDGLPPPKY